MIGVWSIYMNCWAHRACGPCICSRSRRESESVDDDVEIEPKMAKQVSPGEMSQAQGLKQCAGARAWDMTRAEMLYELAAAFTYERRRNEMHVGRP